MKMSDVFEKSPQDEGGINRLEYVLKNGKALNIYGALKELNEAQGQINELVEDLTLLLDRTSRCSDIGYNPIKDSVYDKCMEALVKAEGDR
jgi:hypothetical protein